LNKICVATNIYQIDPLVYASHLSAFYRIGKNLPDWQLEFVGPWRYSIDVGRNFAAEAALNLESRYLLFYDDDMFLHPDLVQRLVERMENTDAHIVMAKCYIRGYPYEPMIFKFTDEEKTELDRYSYKSEDVDERGLVRVDAVGCPCTIIDVELFKKIPKPWFLTGQLHTEDVYFCLKAKEHIENLKIYMDNTFDCGHLLDRRILNSETRQNLIEDHKRGYDQFGLPSKIIKKENDDTKEGKVFDNPLKKELENG